MAVQREHVDGGDLLLEERLPDRLSSLDRLKGEGEPVTFDECLDFVNKRDKVVQRMLRGKGGKEKFKENSEFGEFFVDQDAGLEFALVYLPSKISKEVGASIALLAIKPKEGVDGELKLSQKERKERFTEHLTQVTGIYDMDHGYGAGQDIEEPVIQALAKGRLVDPKTKRQMVLDGDELFVSFMTKGSGGTFLEPKERGGRENIPTYTMDSTLGQYIEAKLELENLLTRELLSNISSPARVENRNQVLQNLITKNDHSTWLSWTREVLHTAELLSGFWVSNRTIVNKGHSMGGWEMLRLFLAQKYGRLRPEMQNMATRLIQVHRNKYERANQYSEKSLKDRGEWDGDKGKVWRLAYALKKTGQLSLIEQTLSGLTDKFGNELKLNELASILLNPKNLEVNDLTTKSLDALVMWGADHNAITQSLTPVVVGPKGGGSDSLVAMGLDAKECIPLTSMAKSPGLRILMEAYKMQRNLSKLHINVPIGKLAYQIGSAINWVENELFKFVDEHAYGVQLIRAVHTLQLSQYLSAVEMVDNALRNTSAIISEHTMRRITPDVVSILPNQNTNEVETMSSITIFEGEQDGVVSSLAIAAIGADMEIGMREQGQNEEILIKDPESGHYLGQKMIQKMWSQIQARHRMVRYQRNEVEEKLISWVESMNWLP